MVQVFTSQKSLHSCRPTKVENGVEKVTLQLEAAPPVEMQKWHQAELREKAMQAQRSLQKWGEMVPGNNYHLCGVTGQCSSARQSQLYCQDHSQER